jgi:hypothetical protein
MHLNFSLFLLVFACFFFFFLISWAHWRPPPSLDIAVYKNKRKACSEGAILAKKNARALHNKSLFDSRCDLSDDSATLFRLLIRVNTRWHLDPDVDPRCLLGFSVLRAFALAQYLPFVARAFAVAQRVYGSSRDAATGVKATYHFSGNSSLIELAIDCPLSRFKFNLWNSFLVLPCMCWLQLVFMRAPIPLNELWLFLHPIRIMVYLF